MIRRLKKYPELVRYIKINTEARKILKHLLALPLLPGYEIQAAFYKLKEKAFVVNRVLFAKFFNYFERQWIANEMFEQISVFALLTRTTAKLEAYNGSLNRSVVTHPNFFHLANTIRDHEYDISREMAQYFEIANPPKQRREFRQRDQLIRELCGKIRNKTIDVETFLNGVTHEENRIIKDDIFNFDENVLDLYDDDDDDDDDSDAEIEADPEILSQTQPSTSGTQVSGKTCIICYENATDVLLNCGHYKYCLDCFNLQQEYFNRKLEQYMRSRDEEDNMPVFVCPLCRTEITNHMHVPRIFS